MSHMKEILLSTTFLASVMVGCDVINEMLSQRTDRTRPGGEVKACGDTLGIECDQGEFCKLEPGSCEDVDTIGECIFSGDVCPDNLQPVCGCDGETYSNDCFAYAAGVNIDHEGECGDGP